MPKPSAAAWDWRPWALIGAAALLVYGQVAGFAFAYLDDNALILENFRFLSSWASLAAAFRQDVFAVLHSTSAYYRPLFMVSLITDAHWAGQWAGGYHLTNLLIHAAASGVLFDTLKRLDYPPRASLFAALLFTVSPVLAQAVGLVPTRDDSLLGIFALLSFGRFASFCREDAPRQAAWHLLFFGLALFTKETAVMLAPLCLLYRVLIARRPALSGSMLAAGAGWAVLGACWFAMRKAALANPLEVSAAEMAQSVLRSWPAFIQFFGKIVFPFNLSVLPLMQDTTTAYGYAALMLTALAVLAGREIRWRRVAFGAAWFILFLAPSMTLQTTTFADVMMEKRVYVPIAGFFIILLETPLSAWLAAGGRRTLGIAAAVLLAYGALAFRHAAHFKGPIEFWSNAVATSPHSPLAHRNLGAMLHLRGELDGAEAQYRLALELNAQEPMARNNLGLILAGRGRLREAEEEYRRELSYNPRFDRALFNYGLLCYQQGRLPEAAALWKKTLEVNPDYAAAAEALAALGRKN